jgi:hypothetical protein
MGATASTAFHDFSSEEKVRISKLLQSRYLDLKEKNGNVGSDTQLFEALKR